jgi:hypothetical protein
MAATFNWYQYNGAATAETSLGTGGNLVNFKANDTAGTAQYDTNPITAGANSMLIYLKGAWGGTFNKIDNLQFWQSTAFSPATGLSIYWLTNGTNAYAAPSTATTVAANAVPTSDPAAENIYIGGTAAGSLAAAGKSDYVPLQLRTTTAAAAGDTSLAEFTLQYDES